MALRLNYEQLLSKFDDQIIKGWIYYSPPRTVQITDQGCRASTPLSTLSISINNFHQFEFRIDHSLLKKPQSQETGDSKKKQHDEVAEKPNYLGPGSDLADDNPEVIIAEVNQTHFLTFNKFCVFRPQFLLLTVDSYRRQHEPLMLEDLNAAWAVLSALEVPYYAAYNCTSIAGASRKHKHVQVLPRPPVHSLIDDEFSLLPDRGSFDPRSLPFLCFFKPLDNIDSNQSANRSELLDIYDDLLTQVRTALDIDGDEEICPHNVILVKEWMMLIPRRNRDFEGIATKAVGMMGSIWLASEDEFNHWIAIGPTRILSHVGVPQEAVDGSIESAYYHQVMSHNAVPILI
ncbi:MAG: hypothetical protein MMC33_001755 [Icmadophila ericetorum]|nr:hypothetical protein [Icmadophila ericetorum]